MKMANKRIRRLLAESVICLCLISLVTASEEGLVVHYSFDEGEENVRHDLSGNGNDGTIYGAKWVDGKYGNALSFDENNSYVEVPNDSSLDITKTESGASVIIALKTNILCLYVLNPHHIDYIITHKLCIYNINTIKMGTITLSVPDELKRRMSRADWVNWSSVARKAFFERLEYIQKLEMMERVHEISEIPEDNVQEVKKSVAMDAAKSIDKTARDIRSGKRKPMTIDDFNKWCDKL